MKMLYFFPSKKENTLKRWWENQHFLQKHPYHWNKDQKKKKPRQKGDFCSFSLGGFEKAKACHINLGLVAENAQIYYFSYVILWTWTWKMSPQLHILLPHLLLWLELKSSLYVNIHSIVLLSLKILHIFVISLVAQMVKNLLQCRRCRLEPWVGNIPWRRE